MKAAIFDAAIAAGVLVVVGMAGCAVALFLRDQRLSGPTPRPQLVSPPVTAAEVWVTQRAEPDPIESVELAPTLYLDDQTARTARQLFEDAP